MLDAFSSALSGLRTSSARLQTSANNISNIQTPGFKASRTVISDVQSGGARLQGTTPNQSSGAIIQTGNAFNAAINGNGFFQVSTASGGAAFTRAGNFSVDSSGRLVDGTGNPVQPEISLPGGISSFNIGPDGQVTAQVGGATQTLGRISLANFNNPGGLTPLGGNLFAQSAESGQAVLGSPGTGGLGQLVSGALETSNVDIAEEAVDQILATNAFKANANVIRAADEMTGTVLDIKA